MKSEFIERLIPSENNITVIRYNRNLNPKSGRVQILDKSELKIDEEYYDIIKHEKENETDIYYCIHDKDEKILEKAFINFLSSIFNDGATKVAKSTIQFLAFNGIPVKYSHFADIQCKDISIIHSKMKPIKGYIKIPTPPPEENS